MFWCEFFFCYLFDLTSKSQLQERFVYSTVIFQKWVIYYRFTIKLNFW